MNVQDLIRRNRLVALLASLTMLAAAVAVAGTTQAGTDTPERPTQAPVEAPPAAAMFPPAAPVDEAAAAHARFAERFALLRQGDEGVLASVVIRDPGVDRTAARAIATAPAAVLARSGAQAVRSQVWVAPRYDGTECILALPVGADGPAEVCGSVAQAEGGYLLMTQARSSEDVEVYGLVPDGVERVVVTLRDGSRSELPVVQSAYAARFAQPTASLAFTDAAGEAHELELRSDG